MTVKIRFSKNRISIIELAFIVFLSAAYLIPSAAIGSTTLLGILLAYACCIALLDRELRPLIFKILLLTAVLALWYTLLTDASSISLNASNRLLKRLFSKSYQYFSLYFPLILFFRVYRAASKKQERLILLVSLAMIAYVMVNTRLYLVDHPEATRNWQGFEETSALNVANYYSIIAYPILVAVAVACVARLKLSFKIVCAVAILIAVEFLLSAQYTLSILITAVGICYQIGRVIRSRVGKVLYVTAIMIMAIFLPLILELAIHVIPSEQVATRLGEILDFLSGRGTDGYNLNGRLTLYGKTILAFLTSPVWGNRRLSFDGHATFLTVLADTGILGGIPFYYLLTMTVKRLKSALGEHERQIRVVFLTVALTGLTNPIHASMPLGFVAWFLAPLLILMVFKENKHESCTL